MRIISGTYKGKQIYSSGKMLLRPTTDFAKEGLFNVLVNKVDFEELDVLDLFSGTGSISYEFASRGSRNIHSVEIENKHVTFIRDIAKQLNFQQMKVIREDVFHFLTICKAKYDIVFADPPYDMTGIEKLPGLVFSRGILNPEGIFILEHSKLFDFSSYPNFSVCRHYGNVHFSFFEEK